MTSEHDVQPQLERRRRQLQQAVSGCGGVLLIGAGDPIPIPGRGDMTYPFRAHSEYLYLTDRNRPGGVLAFDPDAGWFDFVPSITEADRLWSGAPDGDAEGLPIDRLADWLAQRGAIPIAALGVPAPDVRADPQLTTETRDELSRIRRVKDAVELQRMRTAQRATRAAFAAAVPLICEGHTERQVQIELEATAFRHGAGSMAYDTIIGGGPNSAVLHFSPTERPFQAGELVLIDAGAESDGYASDITRTYPVGGSLSGEQRELFEIVHAAERAGMELCLAGTEWREVHLRAATVIAEGLVAVGLLRGEPSALVESGAVGLFFPHGIGHLVGLGVRDAGGILPERRNDPPPYPNLRIDLPLEPGFVVTVEPGIYFVAAMLNDPERRRLHRDAVAWERVDQMLGFGGIRIEDNVLITETGQEIITDDVPLLG